MLISFIISAQGHEEKAFKTLNSLAKQTNHDYQIIIINDESSGEKEAGEFFRDQFEDNKKIMLVLNNRAQGSSLNWNVGMNLANGKYAVFLKEGDVLDPAFVSKIEAVVKKNSKKLDIIQFNQQLTGLIKSNNNDNNLLAGDRVYDLTKEHEVYAYVEQNIYGKLFRLDFIKDFRIKFRKNNRFDELFLFQCLGHARTFYKVPDVLVTHHMGVLKYSAFDIVNQWPHILNYYRHIGIYKDLKDELNYAYVYQLTYEFLLLVSKFDNKQLYRKALNFSQTKFEGKMQAGMRKNKVFLDNRDAKFSNYMKNFESFVYSEFKKNK